LEKEKNPEEESKKVEINQKVTEKKHGFICVLKFVLSKRSTRNLFIVYMISKSLHKSMYTFKNVYYLKDIELGGLGFTGD
jgi:phosphoribosyl-AMP cyclohydrolase